MLHHLFCISLLALATLLTPAAQASNLPDYPFIHTSGTGSSYATPDTGSLDFEIAAYDADPAAAVAVVEARVNEIRALTRELGIDPADLEIRDVRKDFRKPDANTPPGVVLYDVRAGVHINVRDLSKWQAIAAPLLVKPNLDGFVSAFDTTRREKIEMELMSDAIKSARSKAQHIAAGLGRQLGAVSAVSHGDLKNLTRAMGLAPTDMNYREPRRPGLDRIDILIVNGLKFAQSVDVIFRLK